MATAVRRPDLFRELTRRKNPIDYLFREALPTLGEQALTTGIWTPAVDIYESPYNLEVMVDLPGVDKNDIQVHLENNVLTISGERQLAYADRDGYHCVECRYGSFLRSFTIPNNVETNKITIAHKDGVLYLTLPKKPEAQPKHMNLPDALGLAQAAGAGCSKVAQVYV